jgi:hypothetical protein
LSFVEPVLALEWEQELLRGRLNCVECEHQYQYVVAEAEITLEEAWVTCPVKLEHVQMELELSSLDAIEP